MKGEGAEALKPRDWGRYEDIWAILQEQRTRLALTPQIESRIQEVVWMEAGWEDEGNFKVPSKMEKSSGEKL